MSSLKFNFDSQSFFLILILAVSLPLLLRGRSRWYFLTRIVAYGLLIWLILEPTVSFVPGNSGKPSLAVMVDVSRSMGIEDPVQRLRAAQDILKRSSGFLEEHFDVSYFQFSQNSVKSALKDLLKAAPIGTQTDIAGSLAEVLREKSQARPALLLLSDGSHNSAAHSLDNLETDAPVFTVGVGNAKNLSDLSIADLRVSDFAFKGQPVELSVRIRKAGFPFRSVPVYLEEKRGSVYDVLSSKNASFEESQTESEVSFRFVPSSIGTLDYRVEVPAQKGEITKANNVRDFSLEVGREKIRVLYLCGQPSPEYSFLRQILKSDPSIELVSFVILRNPENVVPVPEDQLSLIPFPTQDIFVRTLKEFDLLIFENFAYGRFGILTSHLENIRRFVEERGGGFLMIGGENSFGRGGYAGTGIDNILPVRMDPPSETIESQPVKIKILEPQHPIFDLGESLEETQRIWKSMSRINGYHKLPGIKDGASLLAAVEDSGSPAIAGWQRGKGRALAMAALSSWQWAMGSGAANLSASIRFWRQVIRWLTTSGNPKPVRIILTDSHMTAGYSSAVKVVLQPEQLKSLDNLVVQLSVSGPGVPPQTLGLVSTGRFEYRAEWTPQNEGQFDLTATVRSGSMEYEDKKHIQVTPSDMELANPYPDFETLRGISQMSGGEYFDAKDFSPDKLLGKIKPSEPVGRQQAQTTLWTNPWLLASLCFLLLLEWGIRRSRGEL